MNELYRGAESLIYIKDGILHKERLRKQYRIKELDDKIIKQRTKKEINILKKLNTLNIPSPKYIESIGVTIKMEYIDGTTIKDLADSGINISDKFYEVGEIARNLHMNNIIHGDLTTSNFIVKEKVFVIDFGLSFISSKVEDMAVDLYVFEKSILCAHDCKYINSFYDGYFNSAPNTEIQTRLEMVRKRGRKHD